MSVYSHKSWAAAALVVTLIASGVTVRAGEADGVTRVTDQVPAGSATQVHHNTVVWQGSWTTCDNGVTGRGMLWPDAGGIVRCRRRCGGLPSCIPAAGRRRGTGNRVPLASPRLRRSTSRPIPHSSVSSITESRSGSRIRRCCRALRGRPPGTRVAVRGSVPRASSARQRVTVMRTAPSGSGMCR